MTHLTNDLKAMTFVDHPQMAENSSLGTKQFKDSFIHQWISVLLSVKTDDLTGIYNVRNALLELGKKEQIEFWQLSDALKHPLQSLLNGSFSSERINDVLRDLQRKITSLKPPPNNKSGFKTMFLLLFSWKQTAWQLWLENYHKLKAEVLTSSRVLEAGKKQLIRDNQMLTHEHNELSQQIKKLAHCFDLINLLFDRLQGRINSPNDSDHTVISTLENEFMPIIQQRVVDLQQQLLIARQSLMTIDLIRKQNETQARNIDHALHTTTSALDVTAGLVLAEQGQGALNILNHENESSVIQKAVKLKKVQQRIEQALEEIDSTRKACKQAVLTGHKPSKEKQS